jgi:hypothetical protein
MGVQELDFYSFFSQLIINKLDKRVVMSKKHTFEYVKNYFEAQGCELLEEEYINAHIQLKYKCKCGNISKIKFNNFQQGQKCIECRRGVRIDYKYVYNYFVKNRCLLKEKVYIDSKTKMKYECSCGNNSEIVFYNFKRGARCKKCGIKKQAEKQKHLYEDVKKCFSDNRCELLEKEYINNYTKMKYKCSCGHNSEIIFANFQAGARCKKCSIKKVSGGNHFRWIQDRKKLEEQNCFKRKCRQLLKVALKITGRKKDEKNYKLLGYSCEELQTHIYNHPNWKNVENDKVWHLDHMYPIKAFIDYNIKDIKLINSLDNLQPLSKKENLVKGSKYNKEEFENWLKEKGYEI